MGNRTLRRQPARRLLRPRRPVPGPAALTPRRALLRYATDGAPRAGLLIGDRVVDIAAASGDPELASTVAALERWDEVGALDGDGIALADVRLLAPIARPGQIFGAGANYVDHIEAMAASQGFTPPAPRGGGAQPWHFVKTSRSAIAGPGDAIAIPRYSAALDWEIELAAVIGRRASDVSVDDALAYVGGYTIANDLSARDAIRREGTPPTSPFHFDWISIKCFDGACPIGPWIVPAADIPDPQSLDLTLWVNGAVRQDSSTRHMIFSVAEQIAFLSSRVTLWPGDLILTGTPAGVGMETNTYLKSGDEVRLRIERIGEFGHRIA